MCLGPLFANELSNLELAQPVYDQRPNNERSEQRSQAGESRPEG